ncbi:MAG: MBL fold metallo-hydrolase, partial [Candidatus Heimdallarchaeota archaeon]|nr:MBL fold metallo-hydrolase [Candidatus Heimdallarchaeota archaeon]
ISHSHSDHMGGLPAVLKENHKARIYLPIKNKEVTIGGRFLKLNEPTNIKEDVIASGLLKCEEQRGLVEQSLFLKCEKGIVVIAGCSHPSVRKILERAKEFGKIFALIGGLHGFKEFELLEGIEKVCPTHCTKHIDKIKSLYPEKYIKGGVGAIINL